MKCLCRFGQSENQRTFNSEIAIHFAGQSVWRSPWWGFFLWESQAEPLASPHFERRSNWSVALLYGSVQSVHVVGPSRPRPQGPQSEGRTTADWPSRHRMHAMQVRNSIARRLRRSWPDCLSNVPTFAKGRPNRGISS